MKKLNPPMIAALGTLLIIIALGVGLYLSGVAYQSPDEIISLSDADRSPTDLQMFEQNLAIAGNVQIDNTNVKQVISSLIRPKTYTALVTNTLYYDDTFGSISCKQYVRDNASRIDYLKADGSTDYSQIYFEDICYMLTRDSFTQMPIGNFTFDSSSMLPSYETILDINDEYITGSRMYERNGQMIIEVDTNISGEIGIYRISLKNGLLYSADFSKDGKMIRKVEVSVSDEIPSQDKFILPNESTPIYEK